MFNPYEVSALAYFEAGFSPLPAHGKLLAVKDASGRHPMASIDRINSWIISHGSANIALRLPTNVIALDVDTYKGDLDRLRKLESQLGPLPTTWNSDSRGGAGGKLLFRIPEEVKSNKWMSNINGITIVQHTHRYVMALPSYNKESESRYMWYDGLGGKIIPDYHIPDVNDLTELPVDWAIFLKRENRKVFGSNSEVDNYGLDSFNDDPPCTYMTMAVELCKRKVIDSYDSGLHDTGISVIFTLVMAALNGHAGLVEALDEVAQVFCSAQRPRDLGIEWNNSLAWVLANIPTEELSNVDICGLKIPTFFEIKNDLDILLAAGISKLRAIRLLRGRRRGRLM